MSEQPRGVNLDALDEDQRAAAEAPRGPVCIVAGAGTGKTRTITYRIAHLIDQGFVSPQRVLAVTFTARAAAEMRQRLLHMGIGGVQARTFHAAAKRQLHYFWPQVAGSMPWKLLDNKFPLVAKVARSAGVDTATETIRDLLGEIEWAKASLITPEHYVETIADTVRTPPLAAEKVAAVYAGYEAAKISDEGMLLDFDDLLVYTAAALENQPGIAEEFRQQYRTFVVDEYQDVTPLQHRLLQAWLGDRDDLTVVGDANQTIYSFTGASPNFLLDFPRHYPHATTVRLQRDYRSTPQVTDLANVVISKARGRVAGTRLELQGMQTPGPEPTFEAYADEPAEAAAVAAKIRRLLDDGVPASEIAVLYRMNAQSATFENALNEAGIAYQVRGGEGFFNRNDVRQAIAELIRTANRNDLPEEAIGPNLHRVARAALAPLGLTNAEPEGAQARERWQALNALVELVEELGTTMPDLDMPGLIMQLRARAEAKHPPTVNSVSLVSLHAAKGLEWDAVFLVGLIEGTLPIKQAIKAGEEQIEEERRLFYVGVTRARRYLHCSWATARQEGGRSNRVRTRFLDGIVADAAAPTTASRKTRTRRCRVCGDPLDTPTARVLGRCEHCPGDEDEALIAQLRAWRAATSKDNAVPAYVIFSDATLRALAEQRPTTEAELLDISGFGPIKVERYGEAVLNIINNH